MFKSDTQPILGSGLFSFINLFIYLFIFVDFILV